MAARSTVVAGRPGDIISLRAFDTHGLFGVRAKLQAVARRGSLCVAATPDCDILRKDMDTGYQSEVYRTIASRGVKLRRMWVDPRGQYCVLSAVDASGTPSAYFQFLSGKKGCTLLPIESVEVTATAWIPSGGAADTVSIAVGTSKGGVFFFQWKGASLVRQQRAMQASTREEGGVLAVSGLVACAFPHTASADGGAPSVAAMEAHAQRLRDQQREVELARSRGERAPAAEDQGMFLAVVLVNDAGVRVQLVSSPGLREPFSLWNGGSYASIQSRPGRPRPSGGMSALLKTDAPTHREYRLAVLTEFGVWVLSLYLGDLTARRPLSSGSMFRYPTLREARLSPGSGGGYGGGRGGASDGDSESLQPVDVCLTRHHSMLLAPEGIAAVSVLSKPDEVVVHESLVLPELADCQAFNAQGTGAGSTDTISGPEPVLLAAGGVMHELTIVDGGRHDWKLLLNKALDVVQRHAQERQEEAAEEEQRARRERQEEAANGGSRARPRQGRGPASGAGSDAAGGGQAPLPIRSIGGGPGAGGDAALTEEERAEQSREQERIRRERQRADEQRQAFGLALSAASREQDRKHIQREQAEALLRSGAVREAALAYAESDAPFNEVVLRLMRSGEPDLEEQEEAKAIAAGADDFLLYDEAAHRRELDKGNPPELIRREAGAKMERIKQQSAKVAAQASSRQRAMSPASRSALAAFLDARVRTLHPEAHARQRMVLASWLVELRLSELSEARNAEASGSAEASTSAAARLQDSLVQTLKDLRDDLHVETTTALLAAHGCSDVLREWSTLVGDYEQIIAQYIGQRDWAAAVRTLEQVVDDGTGYAAHLFYRFSPILIRHADVELQRAWKRARFLDAQGLLPAMLAYVDARRAERDALALKAEHQYRAADAAAVRAATGGRYAVLEQLQNEVMAEDAGPGEQRRGGAAAAAAALGDDEDEGADDSPVQGGTSTDIIKSYLKRYITRCESGRIKKEPGPALYGLYLELLAEDPPEDGAPPLTGPLGQLVREECTRAQGVANAACGGQLLRAVDAAREAVLERDSPPTQEDLRDLPVLPRLDLMQALRVCLRTSRHDVLAELYFTVGSYDEAVEHALRVGVEEAKDYVRRLAETPPTVVRGSAVASLCATAVHGEEQAFLNSVSARRRGRAAAASADESPAELRLRVYEYLQSVNAQAAQGLDKDEHRSLLKRLWLRIASRLVWQDAKSGPGDAIELIGEASAQYRDSNGDNDAPPLLAVEDMLSLLPPETKIETFREQISDSLKLSEGKTDQLQREMDQYTQQVRRIRREVRELESRSMHVSSSAMCVVCGRALMTETGEGTGEGAMVPQGTDGVGRGGAMGAAGRSGEETQGGLRDLGEGGGFYVFPSGFGYHSLCLESVLVPALSDRQTTHLRSRQRELAEAKQNLAIARQERQQNVEQGGARYGKRRNRYELAVRAAQQEMQRADERVHRLLAAEDPLCGSRLIDMIGEPLPPPLTDGFKVPPGASQLAGTQLKGPAGAMLAPGDPTGESVQQWDGMLWGGNRDGGR